MIEIQFKKIQGRAPVLDHPIRFNDKLQWLKLHWRDPRATRCADKYEFRNVVSKMVGEQYLNELYGVYDDVDQIDFEAEPVQRTFVC
jgi:hypothetical protein